MEISTILDHIDDGHMALTKFQERYVWGREQVLSLFNSLCKRHPVRGLEAFRAHVSHDFLGAQGVAAE